MADADGASSTEDASRVSRSAHRAVGYLRVSGLGQVSGDGLDRQERTVRDYARRHRLAVVEMFTDSGVSGTKELDHREGLSALLARVRHGDVRIVPVERADRLARDLMVSEVILRRLADHGVQVIAADSGTDLTAADGDPTRRLVRQLLAAVAEFDRAMTVAKLRAARDRVRRIRGRCEGLPPFGMRDGEEETLSRAQKLRRKPRGGKPMSFARIAERLNAEGHRTRRDGRRSGCP